MEPQQAPPRAAPATATVALEVPLGFDPGLPPGLTPEDNAALLRCGAELFRRSRALAAEAGGAALAQAEREFAAREAAARAAAAERERAAVQAAGAQAEALRALLAETRAEFDRSQGALAGAVLEAARTARREAADEARGRIAALEAELGAARGAAAAAAASSLAALAERFDLVFSPHAASSAKGRLGEATLAALLESLFPEAELADCSAVAGRGDFTLTLVRGGRPVRLMVEAKNMLRVRADDVTKFARDCANRAADGSADGALFAALTAATIPRVGAFAFGEEGGLPTLHLAGVAANPDALRLGVEALAYSVLARPEPAAADPARPADDLADVREAVTLAFGVLSRQAARARALRESAAAVLEAVAGFEGEASIAAAAIEALWRARPALRRPDAAAAPGPAPADPLAAATLSVRRFVDEHGRDPSRAEVVGACAVPDSLLRRVGGARALIAAAKKLVL